MRTPISHIELRWRVVGSTEAWNSTQLSASETKFHLPNAITGVAYSVQARCVTEGGAVSEWGTTITVIDGVVTIDRPTIGTPVAVADGISVAWTTSGAMPVDTEYLLQHSTAVGGPWVDVCRIRSTRFTDPVVDGASYWYRVCAIDFKGNVSIWSTTTGATTAKTVANGADVSTNNTPVPVLNANFEAGNVHWGLESSWSIEQAAGMLGSAWRAKKVTGSTSAQISNNGRLPVSNGQDVTARVYASASASANGTVKVGVRWWKADNTELSVSWATTKAPALTWFDSTVQLIAPYTAVAAQLLVSVESHSAGEWYVDNATLVAAKLDAGTGLGELTDQNILAIVEKPPVISEYAAITAEYQSIYDSGTTWKNTTERDAFATAKTNLDNHLALQSSPVLWNNTSDKTNLVLGTTGQTTGMLALRYRFSQYYTARQTLLDKNAYAARAAALTQMPWKQTFQDFNASDWYFVSGDASRLSIVDGGSAGGKVLRADGAAWVEFRYNIPYDPARTYRVKVRVRKPSGGAYGFYAGLVGVAADGVTFVNKSGLNDRTGQHYGPGNVTPPASWVVGGAGEYTFYWKGTAPTGTDGSANCLSPGVMQDNVRYVNPLLILNIGAPTGQNNIMEVDILELVDAADDVAAAKASSAVTLGQSKAKIFYKTTAPTNADAAPDVLRNGDLWYDTSLWTQADADANKCGDPDVGKKKNIVHRYDSTASGEPIPYWPVTQSTKQVVVGEIAAQSVGADEIDANRMVVNYQEEDGTKGSGFPVGTPLQGVKIFDATTPIKIGPGGAQVGRQKLDEVVVRTISAIRQDGDRLWYVGSRSTRLVGDGAPVLMDPPFLSNHAYIVGDRCLANGNVYVCTSPGTSTTTPPTGTGTSASGNSVWNYVGTMASQERLSIGSWRGHVSLGANGLYYMGLKVGLYPKTPWDNLDGLRFLELATYNNAGGWVDTMWFAIPDRRYTGPGESGGNGDIVLDCQWMTVLHSVYASTYPDIYISARICNVSGYSPARYYHTIDAGWDYGRAVGGISIPGANPPPPPPAGGGDDTGGNCVAPETLVLMANGTTKAAGTIVAGDMVRTRHEVTGEWGDFQVTYAETFESERVRVLFHDQRTLVTSPDHRIFATGGWRETKSLNKADMVEGVTPAQVVEVAPYSVGPVVKLTVDQAHTYISEGFYSHNLKRG